MFHLSRKIDYGLVLLLELAESERRGMPSPISLKKLARQRFLSFLFLQKVAFQLRKAGLIKATRGKTGGYFLDKRAEAITLREMFETFEGPISIMHCLGMTVREDHVNEIGCQSRRGLNILNHDLKASMNRITLADFLANNEKTHTPVTITTRTNVAAHH